MLEAHRHEVAFAGSWHDEVHLIYAEREKSRYRTTTTRGKELGWFLPRGIVLADGDALLCNDSEVILVRAATEALTEVRSDDPHLLMRAAYHLGNRHVSLQVLPKALRFPRDHVLEDMLLGLGLELSPIDAPFTPESGAYAGHSHSHSHD